MSTGRKHGVGLGDGGLDRVSSGGAERCCTLDVEWEKRKELQRTPRPLAQAAQMVQLLLIKMGKLWEKQV